MLKACQRESKFSWNKMMLILLNTILSGNSRGNGNERDKSEWVVDNGSITVHIQILQAKQKTAQWQSAVMMRDGKSRYYCSYS
jgi:hypothetical protein